MNMDDKTISAGGLRRDAMLEPDEVTAMLRLRKLGWGSKRLAREFGCSRTTVKRYLGSGRWQPYQRRASRGMLAGHETWLRERFFRHRGNADVIRQGLARAHGIVASLRTVERAVSDFRQLLAAEARATMRFETPLGHQLQIDFGEKRVCIGGDRIFNESEQAAAEEEAQDDDVEPWVVPDTGRPEGEKSEPQKRGRKPLSADLPRQRVEYDLPEDQKSCPCCRKAMHRMPG